MKNEFYQTRQLFRDYTGYVNPLSFDAWDSLPSDQKAAVLFLQFFDQITLAWEKTKSVYSAEEDGVSEVVRYLEKNVAKIHDDPKRFTPAYIYKVAYNCMYCVCRDPNRFKRQYENECSNIQGSGEDEFDLFDLEVDACDVYSESMTNTKDTASIEIWEIVKDMDTIDQMVVALITGDHTRVDKDPSTMLTGDEFQEAFREHIAAGNSTSHKDFWKSIKKRGASIFSDDSLANITEEQIAASCAKLRDKLAGYREVYGV